MSNCIQLWLKSMRWFLVLFLPIAALCFSSVLLKETLFPWNLAKAAMKDSVPDDWYFCVGFENSSNTTNDKVERIKSRTYLTIPTSFQEKKYFVASEVNEAFALESFEGNPWIHFAFIFCVLGFLWWFTIFISFPQIYRLFIKIDVNPKLPPADEEGAGI